MTQVKQIPLGKNGPLVSKLGLGCMRMSPTWSKSFPDETESIATINEALDNGINFLNTGDFYGAGHNEILVGKAIKHRRNDAFISVKFGAIFYNGGWLGLDLRPVAIKNFINYSLTRLGIETIDLINPAGWTTACLLKTSSELSPTSSKKARSATWVYQRSRPTSCAKHTVSIPSPHWRLVIPSPTARSKPTCCPPPKSSVSPSSHSPIQPKACSPER